MNLSNLFEGAVDELERRRIEDLEMKMDDLARRAKESKDPKAIAALRHEFAKCKAERDSYHYVQEWEDTAPGHDRDQTELTPVDETWNYATPWGKEAAIKQKATISRPASTSNDEVKTFAAQGYTIKFKPDVVEIYHGADLVYSKPGDFANPTRAQLGAIRGRVTDLANRKKKQVEEEGVDRTAEPQPSGVYKKNEFDIKEAGSPAQQAAIAINMKKHHQKPKTDEAEERLRVSPHDQGAHAALKGKPYASNPHPEGSKERLEWSKGHNAMRARKASLDEHGGGGVGPREWHNYVRAHRADEGWQDFNKVEPYAVCLAGKPVKKFDYYEEARRFHDNWKQKLYREGNKEKADKITLMPLGLDEGSMSAAAHHDTGPEFTGYWKGTDSGTPGNKMVGAESKEFKVPAARNFVAKNMKSAGSGQHKDAKRAMKQGDVKHKAKAIPMDEAGTRAGALNTAQQLYKEIQAGKGKRQQHEIDLLQRQLNALARKYQLKPEEYTASANQQQSQQQQRQQPPPPPPGGQQNTNQSQQGNWWQQQYEKHYGQANQQAQQANPDSIWNPQWAAKQQAAYRQAGGQGIDPNWAAKNIQAGQQMGAANQAAMNASFQAMNAAGPWNMPGAKMAAEDEMEEGAKVDRMQKHIAKSEKDLGHSKKDAESIAWATLNKRGYLDNANKKKHNESVNFMEWAVAQGNRFPNFISNPAVYAKAKAAFLAEGMSNALSNITRRMAGPVGAKKIIKNREQMKDNIKRQHFAEDEVEEDYVSEIKKGQKDSNGNTGCWTGYHAQGTKQGKNGGQVRNCVPNESLEETEAWQKANKKDKTDGMSKKAVKSYRREHPGSKLQTAVTTKPSKLKKGSKASKRRSSYCSRSKGQMDMHNISCAKTPDKAICKARRRWNCEGVENLDAMLAEAIEKGTLQPGQYYIWTVYFDDGSKKQIKVTKDNFDPKAYYAKQNKVVINVDYDWTAHNG